MNIQIKSIGYNIGTVGWLKSGLESGSLVISEGKLKSNGNHGLWIKGDNINQFLGAFNVYGFRDWRLDGCIPKYAVANDFADRDPIWTDAAWEKLMEIAQKWCDEQNEIRKNDKEQTVCV